MTTWSEGHLTHGWVTLIISHCPVKVGGHKLCGIGHINLLICHVTTWSKACVASWVSSPHHKPIHCQIFCGNRVCRRVYIVLYWSFDFTCLRVQWVLWHYGWVPLIQVTTAHVLCQFLLRIHNLPVMTCVNLWPVFLTNRLKRPFQLQTQARSSKIEL